MLQYEVNRGAALTAVGIALLQCGRGHDPAGCNQPLPAYQLQRGGEAIATLAPAPLYARIDFVRDRDDDFRVMEMELIEPSLYLRTDPGAPLRFAEAIDRYFD